MRPSAAALTVALLCVSQVAGAQSPAERVLVVQWDDSLAAVRDVAALDRFVTKTPHTSAGVADLRIAMVQLRRFALTGDRPLAELALIRLDAVAHTHRAWPWADLLLARAFYRLVTEDAPLRRSAGVSDGETYIDAATHHLADALATDPDLMPARQLAIDAMLPEGDRALLRHEREALAVLLRRPRPEGDVLLIAARDARTRLRYDSAETYLDRAAGAGADRSVIALERAHTLEALGDSGGASRAYWRGVDELTPAGRLLYQHDLAWILAPDTLAQFDRLPTDSVGGWLRDFWLRRDAEAANHPGERLIEHLRRWSYAMAHFRVRDPEKRTGFKRVEMMFDGRDLCTTNDAGLYELLAGEQPVLPGDPRRHEPLLDHRGLIYLHHGAPVRVVYNPGTDPEPPGFALTHPPMTGLANATWDGSRPNIPDQPWCIDTLAHGDGPNESWLYWFGGQWRVMNFRGSCAFGLTQPTTLTSYLPVNDPAPGTTASWAARSNLTPEYAAAAYQMVHGHFSAPPSCQDSIAPMIKASRADADVGTRTDSDTPFVPHPWDAVIQAFALGAGADNDGEALVTFAIPVHALHGTATTVGRENYALAARIVGYDHRTGRMFSIDTVRTIPAPASATGPNAHLSGWFELALDPGDWQIAVRMRQPGDSLGAYDLLPHVVVDAAAPLMISDIVTGAANGLSWPAPDGTAFPVAVLGAWREGGSAEIYYEVRGVPAGAEYQSVISVTSDESGARFPAIRLTSTERGGGDVSTVRKTLGLAQLKPGAYHLTVTVTRDGVAATRSRALLVVPP